MKLPSSRIPSWLLRVDACRLPSPAGMALPPQARPVPAALPLPQPEQGMIPLFDPPQLSDERWDQLADSQARATALVRAGALDEALQALAEGTWRNPEEELRQLIILLRCEPSASDLDEEGAPTGFHGKEVA